MIAQLMSCRDDLSPFVQVLFQLGPDHKESGLDLHFVKHSQDFVSSAFCRAVIECQGDDFLRGVDPRNDDTEELEGTRFTHLPERHCSGKKNERGSDQKLFSHIEETIRSYSYLKATIGLTFVARRAGR